MTKILYIEDIEDNITFVQKVVASRGHEFFSARNAEKGLEVALDIHPDLILLDLGLPDADGQTLSVWLRSDPSLEAVPIVALTAWPDDVARSTVEAYHLNGYLCKPFSLADLVRTINAVLGAKPV